MNPKDPKVRHIRRIGVSIGDLFSKGSISLVDQLMQTVLCSRSSQQEPYLNGYADAVDDMCSAYLSRTEEEIRRSEITEKAKRLGWIEILSRFTENVFATCSATVFMRKEDELQFLRSLHEMRLFGIIEMFNVGPCKYLCRYRITLFGRRILENSDMEINALKWEKENLAVPIKENK